MYSTMYPHDLPAMPEEKPTRFAAVKSALSWIAGFFVTFMILVASIYLFATSPAQHYSNEWEGFTVYVCVGMFLIFRVLAVWWHELGHYLAGRVMGAQLWGFFRLAARYLP